MATLEQLRAQDAWTKAADGIARHLARDTHGLQVLQAAG